MHTLRQRSGLKLKHRTTRLVTSLDFFLALWFDATLQHIPSLRGAAQACTFFRLTFPSFLPTFWTVLVGRFCKKHFIVSILDERKLLLVLSQALPFLLGQAPSVHAFVFSCPSHVAVGNQELQERKICRVNYIHTSYFYFWLFIRRSNNCLSAISLSAYQLRIGFLLSERTAMNDYSSMLLLFFSWTRKVVIWLLRAPRYVANKASENNVASCIYTYIYIADLLTP